MASVTDILDRLDTRIYELLADVNNVTSYRLGQKSVSKTEMLQALTNLRDKYQAIALTEPYEDIRAFAYDVDSDGSVIEELIGDDATT